MSDNKRVLAWILGDQLLENPPATHDAKYTYGKDNIHVVLVWSQGRARKLPYQRKKLVLLWSAMRHYAQKLEADGYASAQVIEADNFTQGLRQALDEIQPDLFVTAEANDYPGRRYQQEKLPDIVDCDLEIVPNTQFLTSEYNPYADAEPDKNVIMESFYRKMRKHFGVLMDSNNEPAGGEWNYDQDNRKPLPKNAAPPEVPLFPPDEITQQVIAQIGAQEHAVGTAEDFDYAVTHAGAAHALQIFIDERLNDFGPYEDAMGTEHHHLWHSILSPYLNIGLLTPMQCIQAAEDAYRDGAAPINSVEGFVRQIIGWREFMHWQYWRLMPELASMNDWDAQRQMPMMFWDGGQTDMNCIHHVAKRAQDSGYTHHIERLMIVTNFCTSAGIHPQAATDWFKAFYIDSYDWVMQSNVVGMGLNADGGIIATKPYVSSANYINKMSDYCKGCKFNRKQRHGEDACPFNFLYWNYVLTNEDKLRSNPRASRYALGLRYLDDEDRAAVQRDAADFLDGLDYYED